MARTLSEWLDEQMQHERIRSIHVFAVQVGVDPEIMGDWVLGTRLPDQAGYERLATALKTTVDEIRRYPLVGRDGD